MKIAVFGDSFADKGFINHTNSIWYNFLEHSYGHDIHCWGEAGSSILFSADLIQKHAKNHDLAIWCLTTPGRISLPHTFNNTNVHVTTAMDQCQIDDVEVQKKFSICKDYLKYIFDWNTENFVGSAVVNYLQQLVDNLLIIPCFAPPLQADFNLYRLSEWEAKLYFPNKTIPEIYQNYHDQRSGHISMVNQRILADLLNKKLEPGIFQTDYSNFCMPTQPIKELFSPL